MLAVTALLALGGAVLALRLEPSAATDTLVDGDSDSFQATERFKQDFGDDAVVVLVRGELSKTVLTDDLGRVLRLEGCLSGNVPDTEQGLRQPAGRVPRDRRAQAGARWCSARRRSSTPRSTGSSTSWPSARRPASARPPARPRRPRASCPQRRGDPPAEQERLARAAAEAVSAQFTQYVLQLALRYGHHGRPAHRRPRLRLRARLRQQRGRPGEPKSRFAYLFPSHERGDDHDPAEAGPERRRAPPRDRPVQDGHAASGSSSPQRGASYLVTGVPVVSEGLADAVQNSILVLLGAALLVMAATLALVFRTRLRLLPLALALAAAALTFGALSLAGGSLTMASIAVLPVLIGLAVDYAIQFQARFDEQRARGGDAARRRPRPPRRPAGRRS